MIYRAVIYRSASAFDPTAREEERDEVEEGYPESRPLVPKKVRGKSTIHRVYPTGPSSYDKMK